MILTLSDVSKSYLQEDILRDINFSIDYKDKVGVIGINGAGKTTLFKILNDEVSIDSGQIFKIKNFKIGYLKQNTSINSEESLYNTCLNVFESILSVEEELKRMERLMSEKAGDDLERLMIRYHEALEYFQDHRGYTYPSEIRGVLQGLSFKEEDFERPINSFSGGEKSRIELARIILQQPDLLLLDEPTNHLDIEGIQFLEAFIRDFKKACLIISHDRYFLDRTVNRIFHIENKGLKTYETDYTGFMKQRKKYLSIKKRTYENQQKEIARQEEIIKKFTSYGNQRLIRQGQSRQKLLDKMKMEKELIVDETDISLKFKPSVISGEDVLEVRDLSKAYDKKLFENINFEVYRGEKIGLIGRNGVGKSTLFHILLGDQMADTGTVSLGENVMMAYFDQEQKNLNPNNTVIDEIWEMDPYMSHYKVRSLLARVNFVGEDVFKLVDELSGGERGRLSLLKLMISEANFLLMDEPTNHLDIDSKEILEDALIDYEGTVFVISHDRYFLNRVVDKIFVLEEEQIHSYLGNYDYYLEKVKEAENRLLEEEETNRTKIKKERRRNREELRKLKELKKESDSLFFEISLLEEEISNSYQAIEGNFQLDQNYNPTEDYQKVHNLENKLEELLEKWENIEISINQLQE